VANNALAGTSTVGSGAAGSAISGVAGGPSVPVAASSQLRSALGGATGLATNPVAAAPLAPTPLSYSTTLPMTQASPIAASDPGANTTASVPDPAVQPQNLPEPGPVALFVLVLCASAMKAGSPRLARRLAPHAKDTSPR
jgi:hypothetical protein